MQLERDGDREYSEHVFLRQHLSDDDGGPKIQISGHFCKDKSAVGALNFRLPKSANFAKMQHYTTTDLGTRDEVAACAAHKLRVHSRGGGSLIYTTQFSPIWWQFFSLYGFLFWRLFLSLFFGWGNNEETKGSLIAMFVLFASGLEFNPAAQIMPGDVSLSLIRVPFLDRERH